MSELAGPRLTHGTRDWFIDSPLESSADPYIQYLQARGFAAASIRSYLVSVAHFSHWLAKHHYDLDDLDESKRWRNHILPCVS